MTVRIGASVIDVLLLAMVILRLVAVKRMVNNYRPPSPLPRAKGRRHYGTLTITRVS